MRHRIPSLLLDLTLDSGRLETHELRVNTMLRRTPRSRVRHNAEVLESQEGQPVRLKKKVKVRQELLRRDATTRDLGAGKSQLKNRERAGFAKPTKPPRQLKLGRHDQNLRYVATIKGRETEYSQ